MICQCVASADQFQSNASLLSVISWLFGSHSALPSVQTSHIYQLACPLLPWRWTLRERHISLYLCFLGPEHSLWQAVSIRDMCVNNDSNVKLCFQNFNYWHANFVLLVPAKYHHLYNYMLLSIDACWFTLLTLCCLLQSHLLKSHSLGYSFPNTYKNKWITIKWYSSRYYLNHTPAEGRSLLGGTDQLGFIP